MTLESTGKRLAVALLVEELARASETGMAEHKNIVASLANRYDYTHGAAKRILNAVFNAGWLERPFRGCYRLTEEAYKSLEKAGIEV